MSLYVILIIQGSSPRCLSPQQVVLEPMVVWGKGGKVIEVPFAVRVGTGCVYLRQRLTREGKIVELHV